MRRLDSNFETPTGHINIFENTTVPLDNYMLLDSSVYGHLEDEVLQLRNGRKLVSQTDFVTDEQNDKKMEWLRKYRSSKRKLF
jgi:hypothetical protein